MTDRTHDDPAVPDDRTRDIMLPPLPDRPPPALPRAWVGVPAAAPVDSPTTAVPGPVRPPAAPVGTPSQEPEAEAEAEAKAEEIDPVQEQARRLSNSRTDEMEPPPPSALRQRTLAFSSPEMRHRPIEPVRVGSRPRRWPWVVLALLPILVIVGFGIAWLILLNGM